MSYSEPWPGVEWQIAKKLFESGTLKVSDEMIDTVYPLRHIEEAFERFKKSDVSGKILIKAN